MIFNERKLQMSAISSFPMEFKFLSDTGTFEGYASVFDVTDSAFDVIPKGAFAASLRTIAMEGRLPPLLWQHDTKQPIGAWRDIYEDDHGLFVRGELFTHDIPRAREAHKLLQEKVVSGLSIGYRVNQSYRDEQSGVRYLTDIDLLEISIVTFPANDSARVHAVKSLSAAADLPSCRTLEAALRDAGLSRKQAKGLLSLGYKSILPRDAEDLSEAGALTALAATIRSLT